MKRRVWASKASLRNAGGTCQHMVWACLAGKNSPKKLWILLSLWGGSSANFVYCVTKINNSQSNSASEIYGVVRAPPVEEHQHRTKIRVSNLYRYLKLRNNLTLDHLNLSSFLIAQYCLAIVHNSKGDVNAPPFLAWVHWDQVSMW